jgi:hypothetical protein
VYDYRQVVLFCLFNHIVSRTSRIALIRHSWHVCNFVLCHFRSTPQIFTMKLSTSVSALASIAQVTAHSWLGCTSHDNKDIYQWMKARTYHSTNNPHADPPKTDKRNQFRHNRPPHALVRKPLPRLATRKEEPRRLGRRIQLVRLGPAGATQGRHPRMQPLPTYPDLPPR